MRSSRNALRHSLTAVAVVDPVFAERANVLAKMICAEQPGPLTAFLREQALIIADAEILLTRIHAARVALIDRLEKMDRQEAVDRDSQNQNAPLDHLGRWQAERATLLSFERYERRTISRSRKAIRILYALRVTAAGP